MNLIGIDCGSCRLPIAPFSDEEYKTLKEDLMKISFFDKKKKEKADKLWPAYNP